MSKIEWSAPVLRDNGKFSTIGMVESSLGLRLHLGYELENSNERNSRNRSYTEELLLSKLSSFENGSSTHCGMTHQELTSLTPDELKIREASYNAMCRTRTSSEWSAQLREKLSASKAKQQASEPSVVMEHDVDDLPWKTW